MLRLLEELIVAVLVWLTAFTGSAGGALMILTILIQVSLHPLTRLSIKTTLRLRAFAPQVRRLRERYRDNPRRQREVIAELYRTSGIRPLLVLLPMLLRLPVVIALLNALRRPSLFRGRHFLGIPLAEAPCPGRWFVDANCMLTLLRNPFLALLPVLVGLTTYLAQRLTGVEPGPSLPLLMSAIAIAFLALRVPAAVSIFWTVSNALYILEFYSVQKWRRPGPRSTHRG